MTFRAEKTIIVSHKLLMKSFRFLITLLCLQSAAMAQTQTTEIWLLDVAQKEGNVVVTNPYRVTQNEYYDNQPSFSKDGQFLYYASMPDTTQSDIYEFHIRKKIVRQVTNTPESEFQPQVMPYGKNKVSIVRVEMEKAQRFYQLDLGDSNIEPLMDNEDSIAYYCWINDTTVGAYFLDGKGGMLEQFDMKPQQAIILMYGGFGRCIATIPGTQLMTYVQKGSDKKFQLMQYDMTTEERMPICEMPEGVEDYCWGPDGKIYCGDKGVLYMYDTKKEDKPMWIPIGDFNEKIGHFYRMAMNVVGDKIAIVSYKGERT